MTAATGLRPAKLFSSLTWPWPSWCAANSKPCSPTSAQTWSPPLPPGPSPGSSTSTIGGKARRRAALSRTIRIPRRHHQHAHRRARRPHRHHPLQEAQIIALAHLPHARPRIRSPFPPARSPKGLHKVRYFGLWHPSKRQHAAQARLLLELERTTPPRSPTRAPPSPPNRGAVHVAAAATSSTSAGSRPKMPSDHDPLFPLPGSMSLLCASLRRHSPLRPADPIIFPSPFNKRSNHLRCPATTLIKSVATPHSALVSAKP